MGNCSVEKYPVFKKKLNKSTSFFPNNLFENHIRNNIED